MKHSPVSGSIALLIPVIFFTVWYLKVQFLSFRGVKVLSRFRSLALCAFTEKLTYNTVCGCSVLSEGVLFRAACTLGS